MTNKPLIITASISGGVHSPTMLDCIPRGPDDILNAAIAAVEAGASIVSIHGRMAPDGRPGGTHLLRAVIDEIRCRTAAIVALTGAPSETNEERVNAILLTKPDMASVPLGSYDRWLHPIAGIFPRWEFEWEKELLEDSKGKAVTTTYSEIIRYSQACKEVDAKPILECVGPAHLNNLSVLRQAGVFQPPDHVVLRMGAGFGTHVDDLIYMKQSMDRVLGTDHEWTISSGGKAQMRLAVHGALMGSHVRVGLDESINVVPGCPALGGAADSVRHVAGILKRLGREVATPAQARAILNLPPKA